MRRWWWMTASIIQTSTYSSNFLFYILKCRVIFVKRDESSKLYEKIYELKEKRLKINEQNINLANENLAYFKCKKKKSLWNEKVFLGEYLWAIFHSAPWQHSEAITWWISNHLDFKSNFPQIPTIYIYILLPYTTAPTLHLPHNDSNVATIVAIITHKHDRLLGR